MWAEGTIGIPDIDHEGFIKKVIRYWVKHYNEPSEFGIDGGCISKLELRMDGKCIARYDRGWDIKPTCKEAEIAMKVLLKGYNYN